MQAQMILSDSRVPLSKIRLPDRENSDSLVTDDACIARTSRAGDATLGKPLLLLFHHWRESGPLSACDVVDKKRPISSSSNWIELFSPATPEDSKSRESRCKNRLFPGPEFFCIVLESWRPTGHRYYKHTVHYAR